MMKKITTILMCVMLVTTAFVVSAQNNETKVSQQIKVLDWLNEAVVDGNQVEGGLHVYANWAEVGTNLKQAQQKKGMLVTVIDPKGDGNGTTATFRLTSAPQASVGESDFEILGATIVANETARDALTGYAGRIVGVISNDANTKAVYMYIGTEWIEVGGSGSASNGLILVGQNASPATLNATALTNGFDSNLAVPGEAEGVAFGTNELTEFIEVKFQIIAGELPYVAFPESWNKPTFYITDETNEFPLTDCWTVKHNHTFPGSSVKYQIWYASSNFTTGLPALETWSLIVR